jgi:cell division protein FtsQ|tara:strand:+ start:46 stop:747 length:702 start_codon:yes stop_codon:yes gene_type:complete
MLNIVFVLTNIIIVGGIIFFNLKNSSKKLIFNENNIQLSSNNFINNDSIKINLLDNYKSLDSLNADIQTVYEIEQIIRRIPFVKKANVYMTVNSELNIQVKEKKPVLNLFNSDYLLSENGLLIPKIDSLNFNLISFFGEIDPTIYTNLSNLSKMIKKDDFLKDHIKYIYSDSSSFYLSVNRFNYNIELGSLENISEKLNNYKVFIASKIGDEILNKYSHLNLKFNKQVIAQKK